MRGGLAHAIGGCRFALPIVQTTLREEKVSLLI